MLQIYHCYHAFPIHVDVYLHKNHHFIKNVLSGTWTKAGFGTTSIFILYFSHATSIGHNQHFNHNINT